MIKTSLITESNNILQLKLIQLAFIYMPIISLLLILSLKIGTKLLFLWKTHNEISESPEDEPPSSGVSRDFETKYEEAFLLAELQAPLLNNEFQYTSQN